MIMNLSDQYARFLEEWKKEDELEEVTKVIGMINKKINYVENKEKNEMTQCIYSRDIWCFETFRKYYYNKYVSYKLVDCEYFDKDNEFEFISVEEQKFKRLLIQTYQAMTEMQRTLNMLNNYHKKTGRIISNLINIDYEGITDYNILKKIMSCLFFKRANNLLVYSAYKKIKDIFHKKEAKLKKINEENKLFEYKLNYSSYKYCRDDKASSGECIIFQILFELFKNNKSLIYFAGEYVLPAKFKSNLRADFFCLIVDKENKIRKIIIEVHGDQHFKFVPFFNDIYSKERDSIKKEYCQKNNIILIELSYNQINMFEKDFIKLLK